MMNTFSDKQHIVLGARLTGCNLGGVLKAFDLHSILICWPRVKDKLKSGLKITAVSAQKFFMELWLRRFILAAWRTKC